MFALPDTNDRLFTGKIFDISCNEPEVSEQLLQVSLLLRWFRKILLQQK